MTILVLYGALASHLAKSCSSVFLPRSVKSIHAVVENYEEREPPACMRTSPAYLSSHAMNGRATYWHFRIEPVVRIVRVRYAHKTCVIRRLRCCSRVDGCHLGARFELALLAQFGIQRTR